jgi:hypothetical protein
MEAVVNGGSSDGIFVAAVHTDDGMVTAASTAAGQLRTMATIAAATIS